MLTLNIMNISLYSRVMPFQPIFKVSKLLALCENKYRGDTLKYLKYQNLSLSKYYDEYQH